VKDLMETTKKTENENLPVRIGIDIGSTTVKIAVLDDNDRLIYGDYQRHRADIRNTIISVVTTAFDKIMGLLPLGEDQPLTVKVTGSGGLSVSQWLNVPFIQEVVAATTAVKKLIPQTDVVIELGGEDAKITYFKGGVEQRMNGTCAGGTGAFIDQMAALLETDASGLNELARGATTIYPIAARCGVLSCKQRLKSLNFLHFRANKIFKAFPELFYSRKCSIFARRSYAFYFPFS